MNGKVLVTCGPAYEPIDEVRRITNASTGELGVLLCNALAGAGFDVLCLKGEGATYPGALKGAACRPFTTNEDLLETLRELSSTKVGAFFHTAALCDFKVKSARTGRTSVKSAKIPSRVKALTLELEPAAKVIAELRLLFPKALLMGWKYEMVGDRAAALAKGWQQIRENQTDGCVVNGRAYGTGFGVCLPPERVEPCADKQALSAWLVQWLRGRK